MTLRADMLTDAPAAWFDTDGLAQMVTYTPKDTGVAADIAAVCTYGEFQGGVKGSAGGGTYLVDQMSVLVQVADVAQPKPGDQITVAGEVWMVLHPTSRNQVAWTLACTKEQRGVLPPFRG